MDVPVHVKDQRDAAFRDTLVVGLKTSGARLLVILAVYPDFDSNAVAGINIALYKDDAELQVGSLIGKAMGDRILTDYRRLTVEAAKLEAAGGQPDPRGPLVWMQEVMERQDRKPAVPDTSLVADAAEAIVRNCLNYGCLTVTSRWAEAEVLGRVRSLAGLAVSEEWRKKQ